MNFAFIAIAYNTINLYTKLLKKSLKGVFKLRVRTNYGYCCQSQLNGE